MLGWGMEWFLVDLMVSSDGSLIKLSLLLLGNFGLLIIISITSSSSNSSLPFFLRRSFPFVKGEEEG